MKRAYVPLAIFAIVALAAFGYYQWKADSVPVVDESALVAATTTAATTTGTAAPVATRAEAQTVTTTVITEKTCAEWSVQQEYEDDGRIKVEDDAKRECVKWMTKTTTTTAPAGAAPSAAPAAKPATQSTQPAPAETTPTKPAAQPGTYTMAQVSAHASAASCWTVVNGAVYDLTPAINLHPGGKAAILSMCGKDSTARFEGQHGGQAKPENMLAGLKIGTLAR